MSQLLHINDNNLLVQSDKQVTRNQGYAWLKDDRVLFDSDSDLSPVQHCRLAPQEINSHYWQVCAATAINNNGAGMRHAADLIWKHLHDLSEHRGLRDTVLVVPSHYREANLQLLLGIASSANLTVEGLVNKAVLALHDRVSEAGDYLHVDVQLHQTVISNVTLANNKVVLGDIDVMQDVGIHAMQEAILKGLQKNFIQGDRFDPLHDAGTEQQLFNQIPELARHINEAGKATVGVQHQGRLHSTSVDEKAWQSLLAPFVRKILSAGASSSPRHVFVDLNAAFDNQAPSSLVGNGVTVISELTQFSTKLLQASSGQSALVYVTELPALYAGSVTQVGEKKSDGGSSSQVSHAQAASTGGDNKLATHLMLAGRAVPIESAQVTTDSATIGLKVGAANVEQLLTNGQLTILNDESRRDLQPNDRLGSSLVDGVLTVIQVV